jgi:hypothetical protein
MMSSWPNEALPIGRWSIIIIDNWNQISNWASSKAAKMNVTKLCRYYLGFGSFGIAVRDTPISTKVFCVLKL